METISIHHPSKKINAEIDLTSSKSESNRALIISALTERGITPENLAAARDTQTMIRLLKEEGADVDTWDVLDAGTTMRFLTAFAAASGKNKVMTGSSRMQERPIGVLVDALRDLGVDIEFLNKEGYPPMHIKGFNSNGNSTLQMRGDVSSQYISALLMVAPMLPKGLKIEFSMDVASWPYLDMTIRMMEYFGAKVTHSAQGELRTLKAGEWVSVEPGTYTAKPFRVEADWSAASYWYSIAALSEEGSVIKLKGLKSGVDSLQGDAVMSYDRYADSHEGIFKRLGVETNWDNGITTLTKVEPVEYFEHDFTFCPDIAQTVAVVCAAKKIKGRLSGLESLRIKETDRIDAIRNELAKFGTEIKIIGDEAIEILVPQVVFENDVVIDTYDDHRMAMAFAPLGLLGEIRIEDPSVVNKSYPAFWKDLQSVDFQIK